MKRLLASLVVMVIILGAAALLVMQKHKASHSAGTMPERPAAAAAAMTKNPAQAPGGALTGTVKETMDSGGYTYVLLTTEKGETWVAAPKTVVKVGQKVSFAPGMVMKNFKSETLNRTFDAVVFSPGMVGAGGSAMAAGGSCPSGKGGAMKASGGMGGGPAAMASSGRVVVPPLDLKIAKAEGENGYTVAELYAKGKELDQKKVKVHAKVVKVSLSIMGKNWVHLQDGTGNPKDGTHDLVVTTQQKPTVGEIVTVEGTLYADKDFGAGYRYDVIIEQGKIDNQDK